MSLRIKRSLNATAPASLAEGQLAYAFGSGGDQLYIGAPGDTIRLIGGKKYVDKLDNLTTDDIGGLDVAIDAGIGQAVLTDLSDVQGTPSDDQVLTWNDTGGYWEPQAIPGGVESFITLNDTFASYSGKNNYWLRVNAAGNGIEAVADIDDGTW